MTRDEWFAIIERSIARRNEQDALAIGHAQAGRQVRAVMHGPAAALFQTASHAALAGMVREHGPLAVTIVMRKRGSDSVADAAEGKPN